MVGVALFHGRTSQIYVAKLSILDCHKHAWHRAGWDHYQVPEYWLELTVDQLLRAGILDRPVDPEVLTRYDLQEGYTPPAIP